MTTTAINIICLYLSPRFTVVQVQISFFKNSNCISYSLLQFVFNKVYQLYITYFSYLIWQTDFLLIQFLFQVIFYVYFKSHFFSLTILWHLSYVVANNSASLCSWKGHFFYSWHYSIFPLTYYSLLIPIVFLILSIIFSFALKLLHKLFPYWCILSLFIAYLTRTHFSGISVDDILSDKQLG